MQEENENTIKINLLEDYKSFKAREYELRGDLIILTGVNGSGKSQFLKIFTRPWLHTTSRELNAGIKKNGEVIKLSEILVQSFKDQIKNEGIPALNPNYKSSYAQNIYSAHRNYKQNSNSSIGYSKSLLNFYSKTNKNEFNSEEEVMESLSRIEGFVLSPDNLFNYNDINDLFLDYLWSRHTYSEKPENKSKTTTKTWEEFEKDNEKPWAVLNKLFEKVGFNYRFSNNYQLNSTGIIGGVSLLDSNGNELGFGLADLSDGEKAIFSLAIASMKAKIDGMPPKLLLLDEYDATFNPSLTNAFYEILIDFFLKKDVTVILTTHNPITATFAPTEIGNGKVTSFYEVNKANSGKERLVIKNTEDLKEIEEVKLVLEKFYPQVGELKKKMEEYEKLNKPILFVEGPSDKIILENAWNILYPKNIMNFAIIDATSVSQISILLSTVTLDHFIHKTIGLFDFDCEGFNQFKGLKNGSTKWSEIDHNKYSCLSRQSMQNNKCHALILPIPPHRTLYASKELGNESLLSIELMFTDEKLDMTDNLEHVNIAGTDRKRSEFKGDKTKFAESTQDFLDHDFESFKPIFDTIKQILSEN